MIHRHELVLLPEEAADEQVQLQQCARELNVDPQRIKAVIVARRSIDARSRQVKIRLLTDVYVDESPPAPEPIPSRFHYRNVSDKKTVVIAGSGPAGLFAALRLVELGFKPVVIERGKNVQERRRDLAIINKEGIIHPDSNYCFGEGGAGTYSDGKLYTRSTKRGDVQRILQSLVAHGADPSILVDAHPHIGTNKLPKLVAQLSRTITDHGGEILFHHRLVDFSVHEAKICSVKTRHVVSGAEREIDTSHLILATGHSARDIFQLLHDKHLLIEAKPFALGVRIEHPQQVIDAAQYHCDTRSTFLPPASYSLAHEVDGRGVYSFCMCPGGIIAPAATGPREMVVNGWSPSKRNNPFANSGMVVSVGEKDFAAYKKEGPLAALRFQQAIEARAFDAGGGRLRAPAQRMLDFINRKKSPDLPRTSYVPGVTPALIEEVLPAYLSTALREALKAFGKKMKGYATNEAVLVGVESRTSSPVRIPRGKESLQHPQVAGLFPCGEGAGYAGGIISAAIDGERCAEQIAGMNS
jgi:uncharacterized protein